MFWVFAFGNTQNELLKVFFPAFQLVSVEYEEDDGTHSSRAFIPIHKRVIAHDVVEIGSRHLKDIRVQVLSAKTGLRHAPRGSQQAYISDFGGPTVSAYLVGVNIDHVT